MNPIEKMLPSAVREKMATLIVTALGLFLALQYNEVITEFINSVFPAGDGMTNKIIYIVALTVGIIVASVIVEKGLDGK